MSVTFPASPDAVAINPDIADFEISITPTSDDSNETLDQLSQRTETQADTQNPLDGGVAIDPENLSDEAKEVLKDLATTQDNSESEPSKAPKDGTKVELSADDIRKLLASQARDMETRISRLSDKEISGIVDKALNSSEPQTGLEEIAAESNNLPEDKSDYDFASVDAKRLESDPEYKKEVTAQFQAELAGIGETSGALKLTLLLDLLSVSLGWFDAVFDTNMEDFVSIIRIIEDQLSEEELEEVRKNEQYAQILDNLDEIKDSKAKDSDTEEVIETKEVDENNPENKIEEASDILSNADDMLTEEKVEDISSVADDTIV